MLKFYKISTPETVINYVTTVLLDKLGAGDRVLWLLSGGSFIELEVAIAAKLRSQAGLSNLSASLVDERWGPIDHADSNWQQLKEAGFELAEAHLLPVLNGKGLADTGSQFEKTIANALSKASFKLALVGMGADGHVLGVKPESPAVKSKALVEAYQWSDYARITTTAKLMTHLDLAVVYARGQEKLPQLEKLASDLSIAEQPAQMLKLCSNVMVFNDQIGNDFKEGS